MRENNYYDVKVTTFIEVETKHGSKTQKISERYLVNAINPTDVEAKITKKFTGSVSDWTISSIREANYSDIIE